MQVVVSGTLGILVKNVSLRVVDVSAKKFRTSLGNAIEITYTIPVRSAKYVGIESTTIQEFAKTENLFTKYLLSRNVVQLQGCLDILVKNFTSRVMDISVSDFTTL